MFLNVHLIRKADDYALQRCEVAEVVEISHEEFNELKCNPFQDYNFISNNKDKLKYLILLFLLNRARYIINNTIIVIPKE